MKASVRGRPEWEMRAGQSDDVGREGNRGNLSGELGRGLGRVGRRGQRGQRGQGSGKEMSALNPSS